MNELESNEPIEPNGQPLRPIERDAERVRLKDLLNAIAGTLNGAADALFYRAEAEQDDMLHLIADIVSTQAVALRAL